MINQNKLTALYERLSRDDENYGDSVSIEHQKEYLRDYADRHGFTNCVDYTDDGWSGGSFDRPAWNQLIADIDAGKIGAVIVKDMSRLGRDHLKAGYYSEVYFSEMNVHFIAIDSRVDNMLSDSNEFAPFVNIFNELYLHDLSRKVAMGFRAKAISGKPLTSTPVFGYVKDPSDKDKWIIDPEAAATVRYIFELAAEGNNPNRISRILHDEKRLTPCNYYLQKGINAARIHLASAKAGPYDWNQSSVVHILQAREYLGETVNAKTAKKTYKTKRTKNPEDQWLIFKDTHDPVISQELWDRAQKMLESRKDAVHTFHERSPFKGIVFCGKCGAPMYEIQHDCLMPSGKICHYEFFTCQSYKSTPALCIKNCFSIKQLRPLLQKTIRSVSQYAIANEAEFIQRIRAASKVKPEYVAPLRKEIASRKRRIDELNRMLKKLYEDYALGQTSGRMYEELSAQWEKELSTQKEFLMLAEKELADAMNEEKNAQRFLDLAKKYQNYEELPDSVLRKFIEKIIVYETEKDTDGERSRRIDIYLSFIGQFPVPTEPVVLTPEEQKRQDQLKHRRIYERNKRAEKRKLKEQTA